MVGSDGTLSLLELLVQFIVRKKIEPALKTSGISNWKNAATMFIEKFFDRRNCRLNLESDVSSSMVARGHR